MAWWEFYPPPEKRPSQKELTDAERKEGYLFSLLEKIVENTSPPEQELDSPNPRLVELGAAALDDQEIIFNKRYIWYLGVSNGTLPGVSIEVLRDPEIDSSATWIKFGSSTNPAVPLRPNTRLFNPLPGGIVAYLTTSTTGIGHYLLFIETNSDSLQFPETDFTTDGVVGAGQFSRAKLELNTGAQYVTFLSPPTVLASGSISVNPNQFVNASGSFRIEPAFMNVSGSIRIQPNFMNVSGSVQTVAPAIQQVSGSVVLQDRNNVQTQFFANDVSYATQSRNLPVNAHLFALNEATDAVSPIGYHDSNFNTSALAVHVRNNLTTDSSGSWGVFYNSVVNQTVQLAASGSNKVLGGWALHNQYPGTAFLQIFDTDGPITLGTTQPKMSWPVPSGSSANVEFSKGISFNKSIRIAATTLPSGSTGVNPPMVVNLLYR